MKYSQSIKYNRPYKSQSVNTSNSDTVNDLDSLIPCSALIALTAQFTRFIRDVKPRYLVAAFDTGNKTFRHDMYPNYKSHRPEASYRTM
jgi:5'-3' exonuclease